MPKHNKDRDEYSSEEFALIARGSRLHGSDYFIHDPGASEHMVKDKNLLSGLKKGPTKTVAVRDGNTIVAFWTGWMFIQCYAINDKRVKGLYLEEVLFVPGLDFNLPSCSVLYSKCFSCEMASGLCTKENKGSIVSRTPHSKGLYTFSTSGDCNLVTVAVSRSYFNSDALEIWHNRFGHVDRSLTKKMDDHTIASDIELGRKPKIPKIDCEPCVEGKWNRYTMKSRVSKTLGPGDITHSVVCGPFQIIGGVEYFVTFTEAHSVYAHINVIRNKDEVGKCFATFEKWLSRKFGHQVKVQYSDNGREHQAIEQNM